MQSAPNPEPVGMAGLALCHPARSKMDISELPRFNVRWWSYLNVTALFSTLGVIMAQVLMN